MKERRRQGIPTLAALLLLTIYGVTVLGVLLAGAQAYSRLTRRDSHAYDERTALQYVAARVHQAPAPDRISVVDFGGVDALAVTQTVEGQDYLTRVYCWDGWLMELFCAADGQFEPRDGERLLPVESLEFEVQGELLRVRLTQEQDSRELLLPLTEGRGSAP